MRALTPADIASGKYSIFDVVMPVPGFATEFPLHACGRAMVEEMLRADGLEPSEAWSQRKHREMALVGAYRYSLCALGGGDAVQSHCMQHALAVVSHHLPLLPCSMCLLPSRIACPCCLQHALASPAPVACPLRAYQTPASTRV